MIKLFKNHKIFLYLYLILNKFLRIMTQFNQYPVNEEAILRKLVADGDGGTEDKRIIQLFNLIRKLSTSEAKS